jgi:uncharacterized membrane protein (UPF0127 family)
LQILKVDNPKEIKLVIADTFLKRMIGLLGKKSLPKGEAWLFYNCRAVHTLGMRFKIDIIFLDKEGSVLETRRNVGFGQLAIGPKGTYATLECSPGWFNLKNLKFDAQK